MRVSVMLLGFAIAGTGAATEQEMAPAEDETMPVPSMEMLEFLGTFQDRDGRWFDPLLLDTPEVEEAEVSQAQNEDSDASPAENTRHED